MELKRNILTNSDCYRAGKPLAPKGILVHSTGVNQKRISAYTRQWDRPGIRACVHGFLGLDDEGKLCFTQILPYEMRCWGSGNGSKGSCNDSHIQFEICEWLEDGDWCRETYEAALEVCEWLCRLYGIGAEQVLCHSEAHALGYASNHGDVMHWWPRFGLSMDGFRRELKERLEGNAVKRIRNLEEVPEALQPETRALIEAGVLRGKGGEAGLDVTEDMLRTMIVCMRYADRKGGEPA